MGIEIIKKVFSQSVLKLNKKNDIKVIKYAGTNGVAVADFTLLLI